MQENTSRPQHRCGVVAIIGPPNAGKSTLLNCFLGQKLSIVTPKPQTTRNRISGILSTEEAQVIFLDTPGVHETKETMNKYLVDTAWQTLSEADSLLLVLDAFRLLKKEDLVHREIEWLNSKLQNNLLNKFIALNKIDLVKDKQKILPLMDKLNKAWSDAEIFPVSAIHCSEVQPLISRMVSSLPFAPALYPQDQLSTLPLRFMAAEIIREKLFFVLDQELPYTIAVKIEHWQELFEKGQVRIYATILVAKPGHKRIVIGEKGARLKSVGQQARLELIQLLEHNVHLELWVKIKPKWYKDTRFLRRLETEMMNP